MGILKKYAFLLQGLLFAILLAGCSHKTLSVFFDGVPPEKDTTELKQEALARGSDPAVQGRQAENSGPSGPYYHFPYSEKDCASCHDRNSMGNFIMPQPALCYQCHDDFSKIYKVLHAPVEAGSCTDCHNPHLSDHKQLLLQDVRDLCLSCHDAEDNQWKEIHDGTESESCIDCHNPHGGNESTFID